MVRQPGFFDLDGRMRELSAKGDGLERIAGLVDFEIFRADLERAVGGFTRSSQQLSELCGLPRQAILREFAIRVPCVVWR